MVISVKFSGPSFRQRIDLADTSRRQGEVPYTPHPSSRAFATIALLLFLLSPPGFSAFSAIASVVTASCHFDRHSRRRFRDPFRAAAGSALARTSSLRSGWDLPDGSTLIIIHPRARIMTGCWISSWTFVSFDGVIGGSESLLTSRVNRQSFTSSCLTVDKRVLMKRESVKFVYIILFFFPRKSNSCSALDNEINKFNRNYC